MTLDFKIAEDNKTTLDVFAINLWFYWQVRHLLSHAAAVIWLEGLDCDCGKRHKEVLRNCYLQQSGLEFFYK